MTIREFFDEAYSAADRYWWKEPTRYSTDPEDHPTSLLTQLTLRWVGRRQPGRALDVGSGEGADAIRLARLGWAVEAVELSPAGAAKIESFAAEVGVTVVVHNEPIEDFRPAGHFDLIISNGLLHYVEDKEGVIVRLQGATSPKGCHVVSCWSGFTPVPEYHRVIPTFPDREDGVIADLYQGWEKLLWYFERSKPEHGHDDFPPHVHSYIKMVAVKPD